MNLDIKVDGDSLEKEFSSLIIDRIPYYEIIWKNYIGHDGSGRMLAAIDIEQSKEEKRIQFAEYHYTCLESIVGLHLIISKIEGYTYNSIKDLIYQNNDILAFHAHTGRIRDCIKKMGEPFGLHDIYLKFEESWRERCTVLHGKKLPYAVNEGFYLVLKDAKLIDNKINNKKPSWNDFTPDDFSFLNEYLKNSFEQIINEVNASLATIYGKMKDDFGSIKLDFKSINHKQSSNRPLSGSSITIQVTSSADYSKNIFPKPNWGGGKNDA